MLNSNSDVSIVRLLAIIFLFVSLILFIVDIYTFKSYTHKVKSGDEVTGIVTSCIVEEDFMNNGKYRTFITVRYEYNGATYNSDKLQTGIKYREGKKIKLYINKEDPTDITFFKTFTYLILTIVGLCFLIVSIGLFYIGLVISKEKQKI